MHKSCFGAETVMKRKIYDKLLDWKNTEQTDIAYVLHTKDLKIMMYSERSKDMYEVIFAPSAERYLKKLKDKG